MSASTFASDEEDCFLRDVATRGTASLSSVINAPIGLLRLSSATSPSSVCVVGT